MKKIQIAYILAAGIILFTEAFFLPSKRALSASPSAEDVRLPSIFGTNMVLQRDMKIPVWGFADPGGKIVVRLDGDESETIVNPDGHWRVYLRPLPAGGPYELTVCGKDTIVYQNVMIGEVWVCAGQSNMDMPVAGWGKVDNYQQEVAEASYPSIRLFKVKRAKSFVRQSDLQSNGWQVCSPTTIPDFSAAAYFFGRDLYKHLDVPIGLINSSWGGTIAEAWMGGSCLKKLPAFAGITDRIESHPNEEFLEKKDGEDLQNWWSTVERRDSVFDETSEPWFDPAFNTGRWGKIQLPNFWEKAEPALERFDGIVRFRRSVNVPPESAGQDAVLSVGRIFDMGTVWFDGSLLGHTKERGAKYICHVPGRLVHAGENTIAVQVINLVGYGGIVGAPGRLGLVAANRDSVSLAGEWSYHSSLPYNNLPYLPRSPSGPNYPTVLYNGMISPIIPYSIRGVIWYQGESNRDRAYQYRTLFPALIDDWRGKWGEGDFPFLFVQLANFGETRSEPGESRWAELREAQTMALSLPNTGMAVAIDIGNANNIHPKNKQEVGRRLALDAMRFAYGKKVVYSGPIYKSMRIEGNKIVLRFDHVDGGLVAEGGKALKGFAIAGVNRRFVWADATIEGSSVIVSSKQIPKPVAVRYGWASNPDCNLYIQASLPASPFRTDSWRGITQPAR